MGNTFAATGDLGTLGQVEKSGTGGGEEGGEKSLTGHLTRVYFHLLDVNPGFRATPG